MKTFNQTIAYMEKDLAFYEDRLREFQDKLDQISHLIRSRPTHWKVCFELYTHPLCYVFKIVLLCSPGILELIVDYILKLFIKKRR